MRHKARVDHTQFQQLPTNDEIQAALWISFRDDPALSVYPVHGHAWGEFVYAFNGVMEVNINQIDYITPPPYGIWLPPHLEHSGLNRTAVSHGTLYVHESLCTYLPKQPGILLSSPLVTAIFSHLRLLHQQADLMENTAEYQRLLHVILDQLHQAKLVSSYLPHSEHPALKQLLDYLHQHPADQSALEQLAQRINMTERTLARYCQKELGMSLHEWRQRLKVMKAMSMLNAGQTVENIALELGYANASAFINMFKKWMLCTPDQFRKSALKP
ncbi:helix-turn-helix transcriptional regulator [Acinetobacter sp. ANC 4945]|uniref:AraC family transcriptional regulator n=1 Tax=Acinetobacter amyesii TaxID=2942470 RepID=A0A1T1H4H4_9GAMM|nr:helix-turn-helix transcriptional regulator [Acinetobacter amyesii]MCL6246843.1 helix-turn-helix transcriptional regulator [Acinetobacter amyesii]OOV84736.1 AraC family transcriptional regulator [Acinetobacter amyesii]